MAAALAAGLAAQAYEYDVREPAIRPQCSGAQPGVWTLDWNAALANAKSGALAGSMTFFTGDADRPRRVVGSFAGILMGGSGYGTVVVRGVGSWAAKIAPCGGCSD